MRRLGVDPGSAYCASTIIEGDAAPCAYVDSRTDEVGRMVDRDVPRVIVRKDRPDLVLTQKRAPPTDAEIDALAASITAWALSYGVTRAAVEEVTDVHFTGNTSDAAKSSIAGHLTRSGKVGAIVALRLRDAGIHVERVRHATWAGRIAKSARVKPSEVKPIIRAAVTGWPDQSNEHERDAGGIALWDVVVTAESEAARVAPCRICQRPNGEHSDEERATCASMKPVRAKRTATDGTRQKGSWRTKAQKAKREALLAEVATRDCACTNRKHRPKCPSHVQSEHAIATAAARATEREARIAARRAAGCECPARHREGCPMFVSHPYGRNVRAPIQPLPSRTTSSSALCLDVGE